MAMTGKEAWTLISPVISPMAHDAMNNKLMGEAYITVYIALKEFDEKNRQEQENKLQKVTVTAEKKCKDCKWLNGMKSIVGIECISPNKEFRKGCSHFKYPTTRACKAFEPKEE